MTKRILVVEDQEDLRGVLRDLLTGSGYEMIEAADGEAGGRRPSPSGLISSSWTSRCRCSTATRQRVRSKPTPTSRQPQLSRELIRHEG
jgi:CheY-like chemotaxis protein